MNGAQALIRTLVDAGVTTCFTNPGTSEMHFVAALDSVPEMRAVLALFEGVATGAADGYARMADAPGGDAAAPRPRPRQRAREPPQRAAGRRSRSSTSSATTRPTTRSTTPSCSPTSRPSRATSRRGCAPRSRPRSWPRRRRGDRRCHRAAGPGGDADPARGRVLERRRRAGRRSARTTRRRRGRRGRRRSVARALRGGGATAMLLGGRALRDGGCSPRPDRRCHGRKLFGEVFPTRLERGAGLPAVERLAYVPEFAVGPARGPQAPGPCRRQGAGVVLRLSRARRATWCPTAARCMSWRRRWPTSWRPRGAGERARRRRTSTPERQAAVQAGRPTGPLTAEKVVSGDRRRAARGRHRLRRSRMTSGVTLPPTPPGPRGTTGWRLPAARSARDSLSPSARRSPAPTVRCSRSRPTARRCTRSSRCGRWRASSST